MQKLPYMYVEMVRGRFNILAEKGVPQQLIENALGFSKEELANDDLKIPVQNNINMLKKSFEFIGPGMAIEFGAMASPETLGVLGQIMKHCQNLREAAYQFIRFQNIFFAISRFRIKVQDSCSVIVHTVDFPFSDDDKRLINEVNLSITVASIRKLLGINFVPKEMRFSHKKPDYVEVYKKHFQCPLKFNQKEDAIVIDRKIGDKTIPGSHPYMKNILMEYTEGIFEKLEAGKHFQDDVKRIIADLLPKGIVDIERISEKLNVSRWTLTRNLKKEGTTFKGLLKALRIEFAMNYLEKTQLTTIEIAFLLGYSEASAFQRAFKSWTGRNPNEYRQKS